MTFHRQQDTESENRVSEKLAKAYGWRLTRGKFGCPFDFLAFYGSPERVVAVVEVKHRNISWGQHDTIHVSVNKLTECCSTSDSYGVPMFFVVECDDGTFLAPLTGETLKTLRTKFGGRPVRFGAAHDQELLYDIPISMFKRI